MKRSQEHINERADRTIGFVLGYGYQRNHFGSVKIRNKTEGCVLSCCRPPFRHPTRLVYRLVIFLLRAPLPFSFCQLELSYRFRSYSLCRCRLSNFIRSLGLRNTMGFSLKHNESSEFVFISERDNDWGELFKYT